MKADVLFKIIKLFTEIVYVQLKYLNAKLFFFIWPKGGKKAIYFVRRHNDNKIMR